MAGPVPKYGAKYSPAGTLVTGADGRDYLFGSVADAYRPGPPEPAAPPPQVFDATPSQYDAPAMAALQQISAQRQRIERERAENPPMSMRDAIAGDDRVADAIEGTEPDSPQARLEELQRVRDNPGAAAKTFARSAAVGALDTAALPVTVPARIARAARDSSMGATGERTGLDTAADLSADEALQDATWLASGEDAGAYRQRVAKEREDYPSAAAAGAELGSAAAMAPLASGGGLVRGLTKAQRATAREAGLASIRKTGVTGTRYLKDGMRDMTAIRGAYAGADADLAEAIATGKAAPIGSRTGNPLPPITVSVYPDGTTLTDGRHRMLAAREAGAENIRANVRVYGPRGGVLSETEEVVPIGPGKSDAAASDYAAGQVKGAVKGQSQDRQADYASSPP